MKNVLGCVIFVNSLLLDKSETYVQIKSNESIPKSDWCVDVKKHEETVQIYRI